MLQDITLPSFGSSVGESTLLQWLVTEGSEVSAGQVIAEIETDKAIAELEAPGAGTIESIEIAAGSEGIAVGTVLARLRIPAAGADGGAKPETDAPVPEGALPPANAAPGSARRAERRVAQTGAGEAPPSDSAGRVFASPLARRQARERNLPLTGIAGSGPNGRIVARDVEGTAGSSNGESASLAGLGYAADSYSLVPPTRMRQAIADGLLRSIREIPAYSLTADLDLSAALEFRRAANAALPRGVAKVSINDLVIRACAQALMDVPGANSSWTEEGIARHRHANIAVAVAIDDGLVAPVLHRAEMMTLREIAEAAAAAISRARDRRLAPADLQGATMTVSNLGMFGIRAFTSILSRPQACILSVGAVEPRPFVRDGQLGVASLATVTLTCDHRVVDGAVGSAFLGKIAEYLAAPSL